MKGGTRVKRQERLGKTTKAIVCTCGAGWSPSFPTPHQHPTLSFRRGIETKFLWMIFQLVDQARDHSCRITMAGDSALAVLNLGPRFARRAHAMTSTFWPFQRENILRKILPSARSLE